MGPGRLAQISDVAPISCASDDHAGRGAGGQRPGARGHLRRHVGLLHRHFGKGPTRAKTYVLDDYVLCVLHELLTTSEQTLVDRGRGDLVREYRLAFQEELAGEFRQAVEQATGRKVIAYHSQVVFDPPTGFEIFVLEPSDP